MGKAEAKNTLQEEAMRLSFCKVYQSWAIINRCDFKLRVIISYYPNKDIGNFKGKKYNGC